MKNLFCAVLLFGFTCTGIFYGVSYYNMIREAQELYEYKMDGDKENFIQAYAWASPEARGKYQEYMAEDKAYEKEEAQARKLAERAWAE